MDPTRPLLVVGARYASSRDAAEDFQAAWGARHGGAFDHMSIAVLAIDARGCLQVERHDSSAKDLALGGSVLRAALLVLAPDADIATVAPGRGGMAGVEGIAAHLRHTLSGEKLQEVSELLNSSESGLVLIAIDRRVTEISPLLEQAVETAVVQTKTGDLDAVFYAALGAAPAIAGQAA